MNIYFLILITIYVLNIGISLAKHGEYKDEKYNFYTDVVGAIIGITLIYLAIKTGL